MSTAFSAQGLARLRATMTEHVASAQVPGIVTLLSRNGETQVDAFGGRSLGATDMRRDTIFRIASLTKPVTAVAALILVEEGRLNLDAPIEGWLPELANRKVLSRIDAEIDDTVPGARPITARDLLTFTSGYGIVMRPPNSTPIQRAMNERELGQGAPPEPDRIPPPDEWIRRLGELPLLHQPGEQWAYNTAADILGVLISRAAKQPFDEFLDERIFDPLGMDDTGFHVGPLKVDRLATQYAADSETGELEVWDDAVGGQWSRRPVGFSGGGGLVSTVDDYLAFATMLHHGGSYEDGQLLEPATVAAMTTDQLTAQQKANTEWPGDYFASHGWGYGVAVTTRPGVPNEPAGTYGWDGGLGTYWRTDPSDNLIAMIFTQRMWDSPEPPQVVADFQALVRDGAGRSDMDERSRPPR